MKLKKALKMFDNYLDLRLYHEGGLCPYAAGNKEFIKSRCREALETKVKGMYFNAKGLYMAIILESDWSEDNGTNNND